MRKEKGRTVSNLYSQRRYWYHVSSTLRKKKETLVPWGSQKAVNRDPTEPPGKRICVAPSIEQCITALPYNYGSIITIYRTQEKLKADMPYDVFDAEVTNEGWLTIPTTFVKLGTLHFDDVEKFLDVEHVIDEAASDGNIRQSRKVLRWWQAAKIHKFIRRPRKS